MIEQIAWDEILPIWENELWPNRTSAIESFSAMMFLGGLGWGVDENFAKPVFFAYKDDGKIVGVNSGHKTSEHTFRSRGVWVDPAHRGNQIGPVLLQAVIDYAFTETNSTICWSIPKKSALPTYEKVGYRAIGPWLDKEMEFGPNRYVFIEKEI